jgi:DNA-binding CsgD family transcriptional regulator
MVEFTKREKEILREVAKGRVRKEISKTLKMELNTLDSHLKTLRLKTGNHSMQEMAVWAKDNGF